MALESSLALCGDPGRRRADRPLPRRDGRERGRRPCSPTCGSTRRWPPGAVDTVEARIRRGDATTVREAVSHWESPPASPPAPARGRDPGAAPARPGAHRARAGRGAAPRARAAPGRPSRTASRSPRSSCARASPPRELLTELAGLADLPGCEVPDLAGAIEAIESASVPLWRGPATGRVRILDPYRARAARARALFCLSLQDGVFPSAAPPDPLLSEERRREIGNPDLRRTDPADEERYLFHSCVSRPTDRLYLSWQGCDEDGTALARSPFVDEVCDLLDRPAGREPLRKRGPERAVPAVVGGDQRPRPRAGARPRRLGVRPRAGARGGGRGRPRGRGRGAVRRPARPEPSAGPAALAGGARRPRRARGLLRELARGLGHLLVQVVRRARAHPAAARADRRSAVARRARPQRARARSTAIRRAPTRSRARAISPRGRGASGSCSPRWSRRTGGPLNQARRAALARVRAQVEAFLAAEAETDTEYRPRPDLLEVAFGRSTSREGAGARGAAARRRRAARPHRPDRRRPGGPGRRPRLQDRQERHPGGQVRRARASSRSSSTCAPPSASSASTPVGGLYHPLGAVSERKPRGLVPARTRTSRRSGSSAPTGSSTTTSSSRSTRPSRSRATPPPRCGPARSAATRSAAAAPSAATSSRSAGSSARSASTRTGRRMSALEDS